MKVTAISLIACLLLLGCTNTGASPSAAPDANVAANAPAARKNKAAATQMQATFAVTPEQAASHLGTKGK